MNEEETRAWIAQDRAERQKQVSKVLAWVRTYMPKESSDALFKFATINPNMRGAHWDDCLDMLMDADAHLEITEPIMDVLLPEYPARLVEAVTLTLIYASKPFSVDYTLDMQVAAVRATVENNGGWED